MRPFGPLARGEWGEAVYPHVLVRPAGDEWEAFVRAHEPVLAPYAADGRLSIVPAEWTHMTIQGVHGVVDDAVTGRLVDAVTDAVAGLDPVRVQLGPAQVGRSGITVAVWPEGGMARLYAAVRAAVETVVGPPILRPATTRFWPHISLAYGKTTFDSDDLSAEVRDLRPDRVDLTIDAVHVVAERQRPDLGYYTWTPMATARVGRL